MLHARFPIRLVIATLVAAVLATPAAAQPNQAPSPVARSASASAPIETIDASGVSGSAVFDVSSDGGTMLRIDLEGLAPAEEYVINLRGGTPDTPSAGFGRVGRVEADTAGQGRLQAQSLTASAGGDTVGLSMDLVADGDHFLEIRAASDGAVVATGVIPPGDGLGGSTKMAQSLNFVSATSASATVTVRFGPRSAIVTIEADGLHPLSRYTAHLHGGTPSAPSASVGHLGSADTDASGHLVLRATRVMTATNASGDLSPDLLFDGAHFVDLHGPDGAVVATSSLPRMEPTGIGAVDASLAAVQRGDVDGLVRLAQLTELPCAPLTAEGFALVPECLDGEETGTAVRVLPAAACEGYWARDPRPVLESFVEQAGAPYAVTQAPLAQPAVGWPAAEHLIVFKPRPDSFVSGLALYIAHDRIVAAQAGCNTPEQLVRDADGELPLIWRPR
jgi:hypothetical protein